MLRPKQDQHCCDESDVVGAQRHIRSDALALLRRQPQQVWLGPSVFFVIRSALRHQTVLMSTQQKVLIADMRALK